MTRLRPRAPMVALVAALLLVTGPAWADEPKRPVPDYDGRGPPPVTPGEAALWGPRVLLSPLYFTSEYVIRRPLGALVKATERSHLPAVLYDLFTFGPDHKAGFTPIALIDFGFNPSVGVYAFWDNAFVKGNDLRAHGSTWGPEWLAGSLTDRIHLGGKDTLAFNLTAGHRPDRAFFGLGSRSVQSNLSRYGEDRVDGDAVLDVHFWRASDVQTSVGVRSVGFYRGHYGSDPSIEQETASGAFPLPDGFERGYTAEYNRLLFAVDSRRSWPAPGSGIRVELTAEQGSDVRQDPGSGWIRYGGTAGIFQDLSDHGRVISLSFAGLFADPLGTRAIPFTELVALGGDAPMPGFWWGRLLDCSAAVATVAYRWPVAPFVDGSMQAAVGNVFAEHLQDFQPSLLRFSGAVGLATVGLPDSTLQLLVGFGTETFADGGGFDSVRVLIGANRF